MTIKTKYCEYCGSKLVHTLVSLHRFDQDTGKEKYKLHYECPNASGILTMHSRFDDVYVSFSLDDIPYTYDKDGNVM